MSTALYTGCNKREPLAPRLMLCEGEEDSVTSLGYAFVMPTPEEEFNGVPPIDENGVDLSLIEYCLSLTPEQRLLAAQAAANQAMMFRRAGGFTDDDPWQMFEKLTTSDSSSD